MQITTEQWDQITKKLNDLESSIFEDRKDIDRIRIELETIKEQNNRILGMQVRQQQKTSEAVQNAIGKATEPLQEAVETLASKPIKITEDQAKKLGLIRRIYKKIRGWDKK